MCLFRRALLFGEIRSVRMLKVNRESWDEHGEFQPLSDTVVRWQCGYELGFDTVTAGATYGNLQLVKRLCDSARV